MKTKIFKTLALTLCAFGLANADSKFSTLTPEQAVDLSSYMAGFDNNYVNCVFDYSSYVNKAQDTKDQFEKIELTGKKENCDKMFTAMQGVLAKDGITVSVNDLRTEKIAKELVGAVSDGKQQYSDAQTKAYKESLKNNKDGVNLW